MTSNTDYTDYKHWHIQTDDQQLVWLGLDVAGSTTNSFTPAVLAELATVCTHLTAQIQQGLILYSRKPGCFSHGVDVEFLKTLTTAAERQAFIRQGQQVCAQLAALPYPSIALVAGVCAGAALDMVLACRYRIAADLSDTQFYYPETQFGTHTLFGGSGRLVELIGIQPAMGLLTNPRPISATEAQQLHLLDASVAPPALTNAARQYLTARPKPYYPPVHVRLLNHALFRPLLAAQLHKQLTNRHIPAEYYPAPHAVVDLWLKHGSNPHALYPAETESATQLLASPTAHTLLGLYPWRSRLHDLAHLPDTAPDYAFQPVQQVHIIGVGRIGRGIAVWCALQGLQVTLQDTAADAVLAALEYAKARFADYYPHTPALAEAAAACLHVDTQGKGAATADVLIEAIPDNLASKQELLAHLEETARADALLATTTSTLPLERLAAVLLQPGRLVSLHFPSPVMQAELVEVAYTPTVTLPHWLRQACEFVKQLQKLPLPLTYSPGLLVNRLLLNYIMQGIRLHQQSVPSTVIDKAAREFGMLLGPLELADRLGLDYCRHLGEALAKTNTLMMPELLVTMVNAGRLGCKGGTGFYRYRHGRMLKPERAEWDGNIVTLQDKLANQMSEEAALCIEQGMMDDPDLLDAAVVLAAGFPAFRGGPLQYARTRRK